MDKEQEKLDATQNDIDIMQVKVNTARKTNTFYAGKELISSARSQNLINSKAVKSFILGYVNDTRKGWDCVRVSDKALNVINAKLMIMIQKAVKSHPTKGKTFIDVQ